MHLLLLLSSFLSLILGWYPLIVIMCQWSLMSYLGSETHVGQATNIIMVFTRIKFWITPLLSGFGEAKIWIGSRRDMYPIGSLWREWASPLFRFFFPILLLLRSARPKHNASTIDCLLLFVWVLFYMSTTKTKKVQRCALITVRYKNKLVLSSYQCVLVNLWCVLIALQYILVFFKSWFGTRKKNCLHA